MGRNELKVISSKKYEIGCIAGADKDFKTTIRKLNLPSLIDDIENQDSLVKLSNENEEVLLDEIALLILQLQRFYNVKNPLHEDMIYDIADLLVYEYQHYTMLDIGLCFKYAKLGRYGKVYERLDGGVIMDWFSQYNKTREIMIEDKAIDEHNRIKFNR